MTDAEWWGTLAETIKGAGCMPEFGRYVECMGLCAVLWKAFEYGLIDSQQKLRLQEQLREAALDRDYRYDRFYWRPGAIAPRIRACRTLMRLALEREQKS